MSLVVEDYVYHLQYLPCLVGRAVNIKNQYGPRDSLSINLLEVDKVTIYEVAGGPTVQKYLDRVEFASVGCTNFHQQDQECSMVT